MEINDDTFNIGGIGDLEVSDRPEVVQEEFETIPSQPRSSALKQVYDTYRQTDSENEALTNTTKFFLEQAANANPAIPNNLEAILAGDHSDKGWTVTENGVTRPPTEKELLQKLTGYEDPTFLDLVQQKLPKAVMTTVGTGLGLGAGIVTAPTIGVPLATGVALFGIGGTLFGADAAEDYLSQEGIIPEVDKVINPELNALSAGIDTFYENAAIGGPATVFMKKQLANKDFSLVEDQVGFNRAKEAVNNLFRRAGSFLGKSVKDYSPLQLLGIESVITSTSAVGGGLAEYNEPGKPLARLGYETVATTLPFMSLPKLAISLYRNRNLVSQIGESNASKALIDIVEQVGEDPEQIRRALIEASDPESFRVLPGGEEVPFTTNRNPAEATSSRAIEITIQNLRCIDKNFDEVYVAASEQEKKALIGHMNRVVAARYDDLPVEGDLNRFVEGHNMRVIALEEQYERQINEVIETVTLANQRIGSGQRLNSDGTLDETAASEVRRESSIVLVNALEESIESARRLERSYYEKIPKDETVRPRALVEALINLRDTKFKGLRTKDAKADRSLDSSDEDLLNQKLFNPEDFAEDPSLAQMADDDFDVDAFTAAQRNKKINIMDVSDPIDEDLLPDDFAFDLYAQSLPFDELMNLRSLFLSKSRSKYADTGDDVLASAYGELARAIDEDITGRVNRELQDQSETGIVTEAGQAIISAWENSKALNDTFTRTFAGRLFQTNKAGARSLPPELALAKLKTGSSDAVNLRMSQVRAAARSIGLEVDEAGRPLKESANQAAAEARGAAVDDQIGVIYSQLAEKLIRKDGTLDEKGLTDFFDNFGELFEDVPALQELKGSLINAQDANEILQQFSMISGKSPQQILRMPSTGPEAAGEFVKGIARKNLWASEIGSDANELFTAVEGSKNPVETFRKIAKWSSEQSDDVIEGFREVVLDRAFSRYNTVSTRGDRGGNIFTFKETLLGPMGGVRGQPSYLKVMLDEGIIDAEYMVNFKKLTNALEVQARMSQPPKTPLETALPNPDEIKKGRMGKIKDSIRGGLAAILGSKFLRNLTNRIGFSGGDLIIPQVGAGIAREFVGDSVVSIPGFSRRFLLEALEPGNEKVLAGLLDLGKEKGFYKLDAQGNYVPRPKGEQAVINAENRKFLTAVNKMVQSWLPRIATPVVPRVAATERYLEDPETSLEKLSEEERQQIRDSKRLDGLTPTERFRRKHQEDIKEAEENLRRKIEKARISSTQPNPASSLSQVSPFQNAPASPQQRAQYADVFPNDITSNIIRSRSRGGIGSLV